MVSNPKTRRVYIRRHPRRSARKLHEYGIVPVILGGMAAAVPFVASDNEGTNFVGNMSAVMEGNTSVMQYVGEDLIQSTKQNLPDIIALGALSAIFGYVGKKVRIPVTKHWRVF